LVDSILLISLFTHHFHGQIAVRVVEIQLQDVPVLGIFRSQICSVSASHKNDGRFQSFDR
jgi:hypothetical protein